MRKEKRQFEVGGAALKLARALGKLPLLRTYVYNLHYCCIAVVDPAHINTDLLSVNFTCTFTEPLQAICVVSNRVL